MNILSIVGARPNFMKVAPLHRAFEAHPAIHSKILHTGQHYDEKMSDIFFNQLGLPKPHYYLGVGGGSHTYQKANVMLKFEAILKPIRYAREGSGGSALVLDPEQLSLLDFEAYFTHTLAHEMCHGLGPHSIQTGTAPALLAPHTHTHTQC